MGQISSDFLELNNGELPLQPLPRKIVQKLNDGASHEHLRLVLAKICAQIPAAAKVAESNLCMPVSYYDNRKVATFLGIQYDPAIEDLPDNVCTTLEQAYSRAADPSVIASVKAATASASETQVSVPQSQAPTSQQGPGLHQAPAAPATQTSQAPQVPQAQAYPPSNQTLPPQTQMLAPQIALQAQQYGLQFQNPKQYQSAPAAPRPVISVPQGHASAYQAGLAAAAMGQPSATQNKPLATQAISTTSKVEAPAKRKAEEGNKSRLPTCTTCNKSFNPDKNGPASCTYHTEELIHDEWWKGWKTYNPAEGPQDTLENRQKYPKGFRFMCCDKLGDNAGCCRRKHRTDGAPKQAQGFTGGTYDIR